MQCVTLVIAGNSKFTFIIGTFLRVTHWLGHVLSVLLHRLIFKSTEGYLHRVREEHFHQHLTEWDITHPVITDESGRAYDHASGIKRKLFFSNCPDRK